MRTAAFLFLPLLLAAGCKKYTYIEALDGDWSGTAVSGATSLPTTASFTWDDEEEVFDGTVDFDGYAYYVNGAASDKESASIDLYPDLGQGPGVVTEIVLNDDGTEFESKFKINICPNGEGAPATCEVVGALKMKML
jgi:hypothetical protein